MTLVRLVSDFVDQKAQTTEEKEADGITANQEAPVQARKQSTEQKHGPQTGRKYLQTMHLIRASYPEYIRSSTQ
jgi:hypothetical protein